MLTVNNVLSFLTSDLNYKLLCEAEKIPPPLNLTAREFTGLWMENRVIQLQKPGPERGPSSNLTLLEQCWTETHHSEPQVHRAWHPERAVNYTTGRKGDSAPGRMVHEPYRLHEIK